MDDYRKQIDRLISKADGEVALNGSVSHAAMVIERMLARAQHKVRIMTRYLDPLIYCDDSTVRAAVDFLRSGKELRILVDEYDPSALDDDNHLLTLKSVGNLQIRQVPEPLRESIALNFSVMDDKGFRLEKDQSGATAVVSFGNESINSRLSALFEKVWEQSEAINVAV